MKTRQQIRAAFLVVVMMVLGAIFATLADAQCMSGVCPIQRSVRRHVQRAHMHDHVQNVTRYRGGKVKVWRVWGVRRRVLLAE
jgi:hypothetical protein